MTHVPWKSEESIFMLPTGIPLQVRDLLQQREPCQIFPLAYPLSLLRMMAATCMMSWIETWHPIKSKQSLSLSKGMLSWQWGLVVLIFHILWVVCILVFNCKLLNWFWFYHLQGSMLIDIAKGYVTLKLNIFLNKHQYICYVSHCTTYGNAKFK